MDDFIFGELDDSNELDGQMSFDDYEWDLADIYYEEMALRKELEKMERKIIDLKDTNLSFDEISKLKNYVWKNNKLIPSEMIEGE